MKRTNEKLKAYQKTREIETRLNDIKVMHSHWVQAPIDKIIFKPQGHRYLKLEITAEVLKQTRDAMLEALEKERIALEDELNKL